MDMKGLMKMKVFLKNRETGQFYAGSQGWSGDASVAHDFDAVEGAVKFARTQGVAGLDVLLRDGDPACDLILPVRQGP
jgi:hypothetical protein